MAGSVTASDPFGSALRSASDALAKVCESPTWSVSDGELPELIKAADAAVAAVHELECRLVAEADARNLAAHFGGSSTTAWLDGLTGCGRVEAGQVTRTARRLAGRYGLVRAALAAGTISLVKAHVIRVALDRLPATLGAETLAQAQKSMLEQAAVLDPKRLAIVGLRIREVIDPDGADAAEQRLLERQEANARRSSWITSRSDDDQVMRFWIRTPHLVGETFMAILLALAAPRRTDDHSPNTRPYPQRLGEAFEEWLSRQHPEELPEHGGLPATLVVTTKADGHQPQPGTTADGSRLSARTVSWLACTAWLILALIDDHGVPVALGRRQRLFNAAQRCGLAIRDKGCIFPGCERPPSWCEAHHITGWQSGGATDLTNGCLLCGYHHRLVHKGDWQIIIGADNHPYVIPPEWIDPTRTPTRNTYWHPHWQPKPQP
jgi:Domain of unknown function (DUF222)